jgi:anaerobic selenocysteine-containing dehydrogenase
VSETSVHQRTCCLCEAMCGIDVHVADGRVKLIRPNRDDVWSKGYICPKGTTLGHMHHDPDRLRSPMVREGDTWREVTWDEAFARCEELLHGVLHRHGKDAMTAYIGNPTAHNFSLGRHMGLFMGLAGFHHIYSPGTVDQQPKNVSSILLYGSAWMIPTPDLPRTDFIVVMGANPHASQGSLMAVPDVLGELDKVRERGGQVVVVDPRRTGTVDHASEWLPIVPGTDAALMLAVLHVLFAEGLVTLGDVADMVDGLDELAALVVDWTPESVAATTGIDAARIRSLARDFAAAPSAVWYGRIGTCTQEFGTLASWLCDVVTIVTGNFDRPGGLMFGNPIAPPLAWLAKHDGGPIAGRWHSRVRRAPEVLGQVPVSCLSEDILEPGDDRLRSVIVIAGNPVLSSPEAARIDEALAALDCMISIDNWLNETSRHAHVILPGASALEQPFFGEVIWGWAMRSAGKWADPLFPLQDRPEEWEILTRLGALCAGMTNEQIDVAFLDEQYFRGLAAALGADPDVAVDALPEPGPVRIADLCVRMGPFGDRFGDDPDGLTLDHFRADPNGIDLGPMIPRAREAVCTPNGRILLTPPYVTADLPRLRARLGRPDEGLVLVSRRHVRSNNSWMHNVTVLVKGKDRCTLLIHPDDAERLGVVDGALARVTSSSGSVEVPAEVSDEMMPGVVCLPHGWGHDKADTRLAVAREHPGVNTNLLSPGHLVDPLSGNAVVNGIPVEVVPA